VCKWNTLNADNEVEQAPTNTKEGVYMLIMGFHMCMWNINLDFLLLKLSEQNNHMKECVLTMEYLLMRTLHLTGSPATPFTRSP
jgi:hypothetical protein